MAEIELTRDFRLFGTDIEGFFDAVSSLENVTHSEIVESDMIGISAVVNSMGDAQDLAITSNNGMTPLRCADNLYARFQEYEKNGEIVVYTGSADSTFSLKTVKVEALRAIPGMTDGVIDELKNKSKLLLSIGGSVYIVSPVAFNTLNNRAKLGGDAMSTPSVGRAVECAKSFFLHKPTKIQFIIRNKDKAKMVMAAHSEKYAYVPQTVLLDIYNKIAADFGNPKCLWWEVTHEVTQCYVTFPEIASEIAATYELPDNIVPGLYIGTSDSADGSLAIRGFWSIKNNIIGGQSLRRNHRGVVDTEKFVDKAWQTIFADYNSVPERLTELLTIDIKSPYQTLRSVFKQIDAAKSTCLGKNLSNELFKQLCSEFSETEKYTAYDIAMAIASVPNRCVAHSIFVVEKLQSMVNSAIFADYSEGKTEEETITLV